MRPGQNKRMRGRNPGRKGPNPLTRSYESNGPDVKIRGTAQHVAEKYLQLARDAQSSGDPVLAENYLQHAEHYFRIVASAQPQNQGRPDQFGNVPDQDDDDDFPPMNDRFASPEPPQPFRPQQPEQQGFSGDGDESGEAQQPQQQYSAPAPQPVVQGESSAGEEGQASAGAPSDGEPRRH